MPTLVDERADAAGLDARVARQLHGVLHVLKRPQDEDVLGPVGSGAVPDCGPPAGDAALDLCTAPALEPLRLSRPCVSMRASAMAWMRLVFVVMSCSHVERSLRVASMARLRTPPKCPRPLASTPDGCTSGVRPTLRDEGPSGAASGRARAARAAQTPRRQHAPAEGARSPVPWPGNDGRAGNGLAD